MLVCVRGRPGLGSNQPMGKVGLEKKWDKWDYICSGLWWILTGPMYYRWHTLVPRSKNNCRHLGQTRKSIFQNIAIGRYI